MTILNPSALFLLVLVPLVWFLAQRNRRVSAVWRRQRGLEKAPLVALRPWLEAFAVFCTVLALARPVRNPVPVDSQDLGQDSIFLVDVSRSMQTRDLNGEGRLEVVKRALLDLVPQLSGDRVALVAFAGSTVAKCPLTSDTAFFSQAVRLLDTSSAARGGTLLGDALRQIRRDFGDKTAEEDLADTKGAGSAGLGADSAAQSSDRTSARRHKAVWVFTDGGDQESFPVEAARELSGAGFTLHLWGVGTLEGDSVPERGVTSSLNEELLAQIAAAVEGGSWYGTSTPLWQFPAAYGRERRPLSLTRSTRVVWQEDAWFLLWPAFLALFFDTLIALWPGFLLALRLRRERRSGTAAAAGKKAGASTGTSPLVRPGPGTNRGAAKGERP